MTEEQRRELYNKLTLLIFTSKMLNCYIKIITSRLPVAFFTFCRLCRKSNKLRYAVVLLRIDSSPIVFLFLWTVGMISFIRWCLRQQVTTSLGG